MGFLRFFLAITVIIGHAGTLYGFTSVGGVVAVQIFYIISGFYMTIILNEKYVGEGSYSLFFTNRLLRLYPIYLSVLILTLLIAVISGFLSGNWRFLSSYFNYYDLYNAKTLIYLATTNIIIFGQDLVMFMQINPANGFLTFTSNFNETNPKLFTFLLIPQAWSVGVELLFYLIAPFIVRKSILWIVFLIVISITLRIIIYFHLDWNNDPWTYRFFPTELALFLFGTIAFHVNKYIETHLKIIHFSRSLILIYILLLLSYQLIPLNADVKNWFLYLLSIVIIPILFKATKKIKFDNFIGELSYPLYIVHILILYIVGKMHLNTFTSILSIILSIIVAHYLVKYIDQPIETIRQNRVKKYNILNH